MIGFERVRELLACFAEVNLVTADQKTLLRLNRFALAIFSAGIHQNDHDFRPDVLEAELETLRKQINALVTAVSEINSWTVETVRYEADLARLKRTGMSEDMARSWLIKGEAATGDPVDQAAIFVLSELRDALKRPIEDLIREGRSLPPGKGRKPNLVARKIALLAGQALTALSTRELAYWKGSSIYAQLCEALLHEFGMKADARRACEWAMSELEKRG